jgi:hypothetical protein
MIRGRAMLVAETSFSLLLNALQPSQVINVRRSSDWGRIDEMYDKHLR